MSFFLALFKIIIDSWNACCNNFVPTQYRDLLEDTEQIAKILTRRVAAQTGLGLRHTYMPEGPFCQLTGHMDYITKQGFSVQCEKSSEGINLLAKSCNLVNVFVDWR